MDLDKRISEFHCSEYRVMSREDLDCNVAICFFLRNLKEL